MKHCTWYFVVTEKVMLLAPSLRFKLFWEGKKDKIMIMSGAKGTKAAKATVFYNKATIACKIFEMLSSNGGKFGKQNNPHPSPIHSVQS